ncbi:circularly permuted type 2 ATP-grasp protein [Roseateles chitosanitabidus]|uniref:circularly permuted type 2 ATP-grasp protein n=1 Tax=Roseateles chitosanitabidus TaxID=65048 RepID=UPI00082FF020
MHALTLPAAGHYDEMLLQSGAIRPSYQAFADWLHAQTPDALAKKRAEADLLFHKVGITFAVYGDEAGAERLIPFDTVPRIVPADDWQMLERGLRQRVTALNRFLWDIYHDHEIVKAGLIPAEQVFANAQYQPAMQGLDLPLGIYAHITGVDLIRHSDGGYYVLEDNLRVPSGVSYMLENRKMMMRLFPELFARYPIAPVAHYPALLLNTLRQASPADNPTVVVLTPGPFNSAYFEHAFLAQQMGVELVEGQDLFVKDGFVFMRTTVGPKRVDVIYRRIDDAFLDPLAFRADSMLGVPGLLSVYKQGHVVLANAIGTGVADDKSIYPYVPDMIRFYLGEEPILHNVPTWQCRKAVDLDHVLNHMAELVVKEVHGAGGYGMLVGPASTAAEVEDFKERVKANPSNYIAQPTLCLSSCPTFVERGIAPRHIDLRPFVLSGREVNMVAGGLTRVALKAGSLVVNSSQGGGTKDTWILEN